MSDIGSNTLQAPLTLPSFILTLSCPDRIGIVADVSRFLVDHDCNIIDSAQFGDAENGRFFMRTEFAATAGATLDELIEDFRPISDRYRMDSQLFDRAARPRMLIMVSKFGHCLNDLLFRWQIGALPVEIPAIVSNHRDFADAAANARVPFHYLPITQETKQAQERALSALIEREQIELIVLARYMQVLSPDLCARFRGRVINIHHSFLPSFKGARPYQQAHARGVKLIGATAHYVTADLDEGPIIEQAVDRVRHNHSVEDYIASGRDLESQVLARAVKWHAERRILLNERRTVVF